MTKEQVAKRMLHLKALQEAIQNEMTSLRNQLDTGDKICIEAGNVNLHETIRTTYDECSIFKEFDRLKLDISKVGQRSIKINRKAIEAVPYDKIEKIIVDKFSKRTASTRLVLEPSTQTLKTASTRISEEDSK